jgi:hypothetical protein
MKNKETLEDASWKFNPLKKLDGEFLRHAFKEGAKWQAENMFSEEEVLNILYKHTEDLLAGKKITLEEWFEKFKNK